MKKSVFLSFLLILSLILSACGAPPANPATTAPGTETVTFPEEGMVLWEGAPAYTGTPYAVLDGNRPSFTPEEITATSFESYAPLDSLGRCGTAVASIGRDLMPTEERGSIGMVKPSGWQTVKYDIVDGNYLYNRCHLIGFQLTGENANVSNLITGTRYLNVQGMLPFENMVADYVKETGNHVMYRVTPVFSGDEPVARGVIMEALSVEDGGDGISFRVFCYNVQPGIRIDYATGNSVLDASTIPPEPETGEAFVLNTGSKKIHKPHCSSVSKIASHNRKDHVGSYDALLQEGYTTCGNCF